MTHPFQRLSPAGQRAMAWASFAATLLVGAAMVALDQPLRTAACPNGIVGFELAFTEEAARAIVASWSPQVQLVAALGLGFDYLFLCCYTSAIGAIAVAATAGWPRAARVAGWVAWAMWFAGLMDAVENAALARLLIGAPGGPWAQIAGTCASVKFGLLALGLPFALGALARRLATRAQQPADA